MAATITASHEHHAALSKADQKRLERLAELAGRTPQAMLRYVLRDGFAVCEEDVAENMKADAEFAKGQSVDHATVMQSASQRQTGNRSDTRTASIRAYFGVEISCGLGVRCSMTPS